MKRLSLIKPISKISYEMPEEYHNTVYIANASLFQVINYFVHKAYQVIFPELVEKSKKLRNISSDNAARSFVEDFIKKMEFCDNFIDARYPIRRKDGESAILRAMRAYHGVGINDNMCLGGLRISENLTRHTVQGFALLSTYRNACVGIDISGSYGGIKICAPLYENSEVKQALQMYIKNFLTNGSVLDVIEPDFYCGSEEMDVMYNSNPLGSKVFIVGKSTSSKGLASYPKTGSMTVLHYLKKFLGTPRILEKLEMDDKLKDKKFIIYGLGKTGSGIAKALEELGAVCVGVREFNCTIYEPAGIPVKDLLKHYQQFGTILNFSPKAKESECDKIFTEQCDILILAAVERSIMCHIADKLQAKVVIEACNGPITPAADMILHGKEKLVIPSILIGGGYSLMSYLEFLKSYTNKDIHEVYKDTDNLDGVFTSILGDAVDEVIKIEDDLKLNFDFRTACYIKAIRKIFEQTCIAQTKLEGTD